MHLSPHPYVLQAPNISFFFIDHPNNIWSSVQITKLLAMQSSPLPCYLFSLAPKYLRQYPILENARPMLLSQCQRPSFTPIRNNRQNYSYVYFNLCIFGQ
jgi:hypothetical protein